MIRGKVFWLRKGISHPDGNLRRGMKGKGGYVPGRGMYALWFPLHRQEDHWYPVYVPEKKLEVVK